MVTISNVLCLAFFAISNAFTTNVDLIGDSSYHLDQFLDFQTRFNKVYYNVEESNVRFDIFKNNLINILNHNLDSSKNFTMAVNKFSDLTEHEFRDQYIGRLNLGYGLYGCKTFSSIDIETPSYKDWRTDGAVTSVKDQGQCGSCWAFSATGAIEGAWVVSGGDLQDFSEQQLVDCATGFSYGSHGCNGGQMDGAFKYVIENGICLLSSYPYISGTGKTESCKECDSVATISSCSDVKENDQISLKVAVSHQPVSIAIEADTRYFQSYSGGILTASDCGTSLDHGVLIVGYGSENGQDYWIVKNSWGESWGEDGYVRIARSYSNNDPGVCGIAMQGSFPTV